MGKRRVKAVLFFLVVSSLFYFFTYPGVDNDLWGHLFFGREIVRGGRLPSLNLYSYTAPGHWWINHEWLAEVVLFGVYSFLGSPGLILLKLALGGAIVWVLYLVIARRVASPWARALTLVWAMSMLSPGFNVRPQIFTYLLFAAMLLVLCRYREKGGSTLYLLPFLMALWVNLHGGFVAGLGAIALFSLWTSIEQWSNGLPKGPPAGRILIPAILTMLCALLNPYGIDLLAFVWNDLLIDRPITEWHPISLWDSSLLDFKLAALLVLVSARRDSWRSWHFVLTLLTLFLSLRHRRHTPLFAVAAAPFLAEGLQRMIDWSRRKAWESGLFSPLQRIGGAGVLLAALFQIVWIGKIHWQYRFHLVVSPLEYPTQAVRFLQRNHIRGNAAVPFDWGEFLIWKLYPSIRVSMDGRYTTAYPMTVIKQSWEWMGGGKGWKEYLDRHPADLAITKRNHPITSLLREDPAWVYVYSDPVAFVFVKKTPAQARLLESFKAGRLLRGGSPPVYFPG